ncbi:hypothetical protein INR49_023259, partial [Caranx melampygus]
MQCPPKADNDDTGKNTFLKSVEEWCEEKEDKKYDQGADQTGDLMKAWRNVERQRCRNKEMNNDFVHDGSGDPLTFMPTECSRAEGEGRDEKKTWREGGDYWLWVTVTMVTKPQLMSCKDEVIALENAHPVSLDSSKRTAASQSSSMGATLGGSKAREIVLESCPSAVRVLLKTTDAGKSPAENEGK